MVKFLYWSDLHREFGTADKPVSIPLPESGAQRRDIDAILIAGDLHVGPYHVPSLEEISDTWGVPVISIRGNHEFYHEDLADLGARQEAQAAEARARGKDVHILDQDVFIIGDTRIIGATLWTDFAINGHQREMMFGARHMMRDYVRIMADHKNERFITPQDTLNKHLSDKAWIVEELKKPWAGKTLVMTHHIPVPEALDPRAGKGEYAPAYVSDLRADILDLSFDAWISGHSHQARRGLLPGVNGTPAFLANMMGYPDQQTNFEPSLVLDMDNPTAGLDMLEIIDPTLSHLQCADKIVEGLRQGMESKDSLTV